MRRVLSCLLGTMLIVHPIYPRPVRSQEPSHPQAPGGVPPRPQETVEVMLHDGTAIELEVRSTISSETAKVGDVVDFQVLKPVVVDGTVVILRAAAARGYIAEAYKARSWGRPGKLEVRVKDVTCTDGNRAALRATRRAEGGGNTGKVTTAVVVTALVFFPVAPLWGFVKGKRVEIPGGTRFESYVQGDSVVRLVPEEGKESEASAPPAKP